ncbi:MAG: AAA family ATPase [Verrucomicrobia bacterium]|nr:AAA family ATPase [Verrucomicrobiota bacterium]
MKVAVTGKGGSGKTTLSALLAGALHGSGRKVIAIDADPNANLLACMGSRSAGSVRPLIELNDLIEERTGVKPGAIGGMFKINPRVDDIPQKYAVNVNGVKVLVAGAVKKGGTGCYCPENAFVRALVSHLFLDKDTALILDMEAGIEHLSRGTTEAVDRLLVVVEPGRCSVETALRISGLAADLGLSQVSVIGNKIRSESDIDLLQEALPNLQFVGFMPYDEKLRAAELAGKSVAGASRSADGIAAKIIRQLERLQTRPATAPLRNRLAPKKSVKELEKQNA